MPRPERKGGNLPGSLPGGRGGGHSQEASHSAEMQTRRWLPDLENLLERKQCLTRGKRCAVAGFHCIPALSFQCLFQS